MAKRRRCWRGWRLLAFVAAGAPLGACALLFAGEVGSVAATGKTLNEHAADVATGKDCRVVAALARPDRKLCETRGSAETKGDFKGLMTE
jgi:hypothetical protein